VSLRDRILRLAWLSPDVLERLDVRREPCANSPYDLCFVASLPWEDQPARVFDSHSDRDGLEHVAV